MVRARIPDRIFPFIFDLFVEFLNDIMKYFLMLAMSLSFLAISCGSIEAPSLQNIVDVEIIEISNKILEIDAAMVIYNPNPFALNLAEADMKAIIDGMELVLCQV